MNPILYESGTITFTNNGIGRLSDCTRCEVTEERNGIFEVEFDYPITGAHYTDIVEGRIISVTHDEQKDRQPFIIYQRTAPLDGVVTFYAYHISYLLSNIVVTPFTATSVASAFSSISANSMNTNPFTFWTDNITAGTADIAVPSSIRSVLGGVRGSILDVFGGEYEFDNYIVRNYSSRGADNGVTIRYGKNLTDLNQEISIMGLYDSIVPYWVQDDTVVYGGIITGSGQTQHLVTTMDFTNEFEGDDPPTVAQLNAKALQYLNTNKPWVPSENIKVDFVSLWQTNEYSNIAPLERVRLCDTVTVIYPDLGVQTTAKVIKVVWDALEDRYSEIELGETRSSFADTIIKDATKDIAGVIENVPTKSYVQAAIDQATELITGGMGGHIVFVYDADGKPTEMLVMDTDSTATAVHVLRINVNGIGFSSTGVNGPYTSAWTLDGQFVADFITAGTMSANRISGGTLSLGGADNGNGVIIVYNASGTEIGRWDKDGLNATGNLVIKYQTYKALYGLIYFYYWNNTRSDLIYGSGAGFRIGTEDKHVAFSTGINNSTIESVKTQLDTRVETIGYPWEKNIFITPDGTNGQIVTFAVQTSSFNLRFKERGTSPYQNVSDGSVTISGSAQVNIQRSALINNSRILFSTVGLSPTNDDVYYEQHNNKLRINLTANAYLLLDPSSSQTGTFFDAKASNNVRLRYDSLYWRIDGYTRSGSIAVDSGSSRRFKRNISYEIDSELNPNKLYNLRLAQFVYRDDYKDIQYADMRGKTIIGFIAEDVEEVYPDAVIYDEDDQVQSWDERRLLPPMLALIQEQKKTIDSLEARIEKLENALNKVLGVTQ